MIKLAEMTDLEKVLQITHDTISKIYSRYYAEGVVQFFLEHHSRENVLSDIEDGIVWLLEEEDGTIGTVTVKENAVNRLFVLPEYQSRGYGSQLMDFAERKIAEQFTYVHIDSSLAAKEMYVKRGYQQKRTCRIPADNGDILIYDEMEKRVDKQWNGINYDGRIFIPQSNTGNGKNDIMPERLERKVVYESDWVALYSDKVRMPDGRVFDSYHKLHYPHESISVVIINERNEFMMIQSKRYITSRLEWEIPAGRIERNETPEDAARRECLEETGCILKNLNYLCCYNPNNGMSDLKIHLFMARVETETSDIDENEVNAKQWVSKDKVLELLKNNKSQCGVSMLGLLYAIQFCL